MQLDPFNARFLLQTAADLRSLGSQKEENSDLEKEEIKKPLLVAGRGEETFFTSLKCKLQFIYLILFLKFRTLSS